MTAAARSLAASPYARKLARARSVPIEALAGSGPAGRIVAADVLAFPPATAAAAPPVAAPVPPPAPSPSPAPALPLILATTLTAAPLSDLLARTAGAGLALDLEDLALRAATLALAALPAPGAITLERGARQVLVDAEPRLSAGHCRRTRLAAEAAGGDDAAAPALLSLGVVAARAMPLALPLLPGRALRLRLTLDDGQVSALLAADPARLTEAEATAVLETFAALLDQPLALLA